MLPAHQKPMQIEQKLNLVRGGFFFASFFVALTKKVKKNRHPAARINTDGCHTHAALHLTQYCLPYSCRVPSTQCASQQSDRMCDLCALVITAASALFFMCPRQ